MASQLKSTFLLIYTEFEEDGIVVFYDRQIGQLRTQLWETYIYTIFSFCVLNTTYKEHLQQLKFCSLARATLIRPPHGLIGSRLI